MFWNLTRAAFLFSLFSLLSLLSLFSIYAKVVVFSSDS